MNNNDINLLASYASITSLIISLMSLFYAGSIKSNIIKVRRKTRLYELLNSVYRIQSDAIPLSDTSVNHIRSLKENIIVKWWQWNNDNKCAAKKVHDKIDALIYNQSQYNLEALKEALKDFESYRGEI